MRSLPPNVPSSPTTTNHQPSKTTSSIFLTPNRFPLTPECVAFFDLLLTLSLLHTLTTRDLFDVLRLTRVVSKIQPKTNQIGRVQALLNSFPATAPLSPRPFFPQLTIYTHTNTRTRQVTSGRHGVPSRRPTQPVDTEISRGSTSKYRRSHPIPFYTTVPMCVDLFSLSLSE